MLTAGHVALSDLIQLLSASGLNVIERGTVGIRGLQFVIATKEPRS
jgi:hypothetical protein